ncbi:MAG: DUF362 domain-containing protein [Methanomassiliicoccales archaeon]|jgi:uncharacterized protein (DUF362 family)
MNDTRVAARRLENVESDKEVEVAVGRVFGLLDIERDLAGTSSVVVKPNVCWGEDWKTGGTTCPQLIRALVHLLRDHGIDKVTLAEGSMVGMKTVECLTKLGFMDLAKDLDLNVVDLNEDDTVDIDVPNHFIFKKIEVAKTIAESEYFINMPVMKTHINTLVTLSMKNLKGAIPQRWKKRLHYMGLDGGIADLASALTPDLILMDGLVGQEGMGPLTGTPAYAQVLMASRDPLAIDIVASMAMGFDPAEIKHLSMYATRHGIDINSFRPVVVGMTMSDLDLDFEKPHFALEGAYEGVEILWGEPCSGCAGALSVALERMEKAGELDEIRRNGGMTIALGKDVDPTEKARLILIGKCQHRNRGKGIYIPGCPPPGMIVRDIILKLNKAQSKYGGDAFIKEAEELYKGESD